MRESRTLQCLGMSLEDFDQEVWKIGFTVTGCRVWGFDGFGVPGLGI